MYETRWLYVDLNSYFASVEQQIHPLLRKKPIGIVPMLAETTCCIAASYEAKAFGVKTGTKVADARKMCPGIQFIEARHRIYVEYHNKIVEAVESCVPVTDVMSIDEVACELMGRENKLDNAKDLAMKIKSAIYKVGSQLHCSIGIAPSKYLSKVASDMQKPNGLTIIEKKQLPQILYSLKLRDFPGIGNGMEERLFKHNILTSEQLCSLDIHTMRKIWGGINGEKFYGWLRGEHIDTKTEGDKSIGHSHVLPPHLRNPSGAYSIGLKLLHKAAVRLRKKNLWVSQVAISIRYTDQTKWRDDAHISECQDTLTLNEAFKFLWNRRKNGTPLKISIRLLNLISENDRTFSLFDNKKRNKLSHTIDHINAKYGKNIIYSAATLPAKTAAPTRIAFTNIPDFSVDDE